MKKFRLTNVEVVIETNDEEMTEAEALVWLQRPFRFIVEGVAHDGNTGKVIILFSDR